MARLIDADALPIKFDGHTVAVWKNDIDNAPTVDAVPVVRCKDCKHFFKDDRRYVIVYRCELLHEDMRDYFFCADGERREDGKAD